MVVGERGDPDPRDFEPDDRWMYTREPVTKEERKKMVGRILEEAVKVTFRNHVYTYSNKLYIQRKGGAIGLRLTGVIARIVMDRWATRFRKAMKEGKLEEFLLEKYVDDVNLVTQILEEGWSWTGKIGRKEELKLTWSQEQVIRDREEGMSKEERTLERLREVASKLVPGIIFTADSPGKHSTGKVPMLDVCVWKEGVDLGGREDTLIRHGFFEKPSASPTVFQGRGQLPPRTR